MQLYVDGELLPREAAKISTFNHGLRYGDGVFERIRIYTRRSAIKHTARRPAAREHAVDDPYAVGLARPEVTCLKARRRSTVVPAGGAPGLRWSSKRRTSNACERLARLVVSFTQADAVVRQRLRQAQVCTECVPDWVPSQPIGRAVDGEKPARCLACDGLEWCSDWRRGACQAQGRRFDPDHPLSVSRKIAHFEDRSRPFTPGARHASIRDVRSRPHGGARSFNPARTEYPRQPASPRTPDARP
jgi:hypothetical protein